MGMFDKLFGEKHSIDRFVGGTKKDQKEVKKQMDRRFREQDYDALKPLEREKTEFEKEAIRIVNEATDALRERYGLSAYEVPEKNIHIIRDTPESRKELGQESAHGKFSEMKQTIVSMEQGTRMGTLHGLFHEMVHFKSYASIDVYPDEKAIAGRRMGLAARDSERNRHDFVPLNEAVTEELTKRFIRGQEEAHAADADVKNLRTARARYPEEVVEDAYSVTVQGRTEKGGTRLAFTGFGYKEERKALNLLIGKLKERNPEKFRDDEECFDMFAGAMLNGHLLELARAIEGSFGKGKFRELGECKTGEEMLKFVESL